MAIRLTIGTRGSKLALAQANWLAHAFRAAHPGSLVDIEVIRTQGDAVVDRPLSQFDDKGLFTTEIETALREGLLDCAVHSLKDLPTEEPADLTIAAIPEREDPRDALVTSVRVEDAASVLDALPRGAKVGTSSLRRAAQLRRLRPDLVIEDIRGNVDTRLRKVREGEYDATVLAMAGLNRLGLAAEAVAAFPPNMMLPAAGQGALAIQARSEDKETVHALSALDHWATRQAVTAERAFLAALGGGCHTPIAAHAEVSGHNMQIWGFTADPDGGNTARDRLNASSDDPAWAGRKLARMMRPWT